MKQLNIFFGIFLALAVSRFIPHPPNFTSLIALSFYVPALFGRKYIFAVILSFAITDLFIGYHSGTHWTWGSVLLIGLFSAYFTKNYLSRMSGALIGALIFFIVTNLGVWTTGMYGYSISGLTTCYIMAIPFFTYTFISTFIFSFLIEICYKFYKLKFSSI
tara:strand:+ start:20 stop:502 length:483 start_codon:yes stop_codon:yes gene_type:complete